MSHESPAPPGDDPDANRRRRWWPWLLAASFIPELLLVLLGVRACAAQSAPERRVVAGAGSMLVQDAVHATALASADHAALTLADAIARAHVHHASVRVADADVRRSVGEAEVARGVLRSRVIPELSATLTYQRLLQNQFVAIARRFGAQPDSVAALDPLATVFNARQTLTGQLEARLTPFDGGVAAARMRAARATRRATELDAEAARAQLTLDVITAYADARLGAEAVAIADSAVAQAERALAVARVAVARGRAAEFEVVRAAAAVEGERPALAAARTAQRLAEVRLRQLIGWPPDGALHLITQRDAATVADTMPPTAADAPLPVRRAAFEREAAGALVDAERRARLPSLVIAATHQRIAYPAPPTLGWTTFFPNTTLVVQLSVPLDLSGRTTGAIRAATAARAAADARAELVTEQHQLVAAAADAAREEAATAWAAGIAGADAAARAHAIAEARFAAGRSSQLELQDARQQWASARLTRARAVRDWEVAVARQQLLAMLPLEAR